MNLKFGFRVINNMMEEGIVIPKDIALYIATEFMTDAQQFVNWIIATHQSYRSHPNVKEKRWPMNINKMIEDWKSKTVLSAYLLTHLYNDDFKVKVLSGGAGINESTIQPLKQLRGMFFKYGKQLAFFQTRSGKVNGRFHMSLTEGLCLMGWFSDSKINGKMIFRSFDPARPFISNGISMYKIHESDLHKLEQSLMNARKYERLVPQQDIYNCLSAYTYEWILKPDR
jgi:hypothetical protein